MFKKILASLLILIFVLTSGLLIAACQVGAWNIIFPTSRYESTPPPLPEDLSEPAILVFSKTNAFRHFDGIEGGVAFFDTLSKEKEWSVFHTENSAVFNKDDLSNFSVVVFNNVTGNVLSEEQDQIFQQWLEAGGGWIGLHGAGDDSHSDWSWYSENLIGANFTAHIMGPQFQIATLVVDDTSHVITQGLASSWQHNEEWYSWDESVREKGFNVLLSVDESTYTPRMKFLGMDKDLRMGDHPIAWNRCIGNGRALYSALGHRGDAYESGEYRAFLYSAMDWLMDEAACTE